MSPQEAATRRRVYLDNAATTWPKCEAAVDAAQKFVRDCGATAGRGAYHSALQADRWLEDARSNVARLIGAESGAAIAMNDDGQYSLQAFSDFPQTWSRLLFDRGRILYR